MARFRESKIETQRVVSVPVEAGQVGRSAENEKEEGLHDFDVFRADLFAI